MDEEILAKVRKTAIIGAFFGLAVVFFFMRWHAALVIYVVLVGLFATLAILIQSGKGGGLAASLGGLGGESLLGVRSATPIAKATYVMLALFLFICMLTAVMGSPKVKGKGLLDTAAPAAAPAQLPALPAAGTVPPLAPSTPAAPQQSPAPKPNEAAPAAPPQAPAQQPKAATPAAPAAPAPSPKPEGATQP
jgi:preprotein translocase subunit SecG